MITLREKTILSAALVLVAIVIGLAAEHVKQARALASAEAFGQAKLEEARSAERRISERDHELQKRQAQWEQEKKEITSAKQAVRVIEKYVPTARAVEIKREELPAQVAEKLPDAPNYGVLPEQSLMELAKQTVQCRQDKDQLVTCQADLKDTEIARHADQERAKHWEQAAKGGSAARRLFRLGILAGCAGGGAWLGGQRNGRAAAIGAAGAVAGCSLLMK